MALADPTPEELLVIEEAVERALARNEAAVPASMREAYRAELRAALSEHWAARRLTQRLAERRPPDASEERALGDAAVPPPRAAKVGGGS